MAKRCVLVCVWHWISIKFAFMHVHERSVVCLEQQDDRYLVCNKVCRVYCAFYRFIWHYRIVITIVVVIVCFVIYMRLHEIMNLHLSFLFFIFIASKQFRHYMLTGKTATNWENVIKFISLCLLPKNRKVGTLFPIADLHISKNEWRVECF